MTRESWTQYVQRISDGVPRKEVAKAAGINVSGLSRWISGASRPSAEKVVAFARGLRQSPIEALIAAEYLEPQEISGVIEVIRSRSDLSDLELLTELGERLTQRPARHQVDDITPRLARPHDSGKCVQDDHGLV